MTSPKDAPPRIRELVLPSQSGAASRREPRSDMFSVRRLSSFYQGPGSRMFDVSFLSLEVAQYLEWETWHLGILIKNSQTDHLVELGCGTGRHLEFSMLHGCTYDGVDLVAEMVKTAQAGISVDDEKRCRVHVGPCESLEEFVADRFTPRSLALYPFNFIGNVADPARALSPVRRMNGRALVSFFQPSDRATAVRQTYYEGILGSTPSMTRVEPGILFTSADGFKSFAFHEDQLAALFDGLGFRWTQYAKLEDIAWMYLVESP